MKRILSAALSCLVLTSSISAATTDRAHQTGSPRRVVAADYEKKRLAVISQDGKVEWEEKIGDIHDLHVLPNGNLLFQTSWTRLVEMTPEHKVVWEYDAAKLNGNEGKPVEVHAFQRLPDGVTMIAESGPGRIIEVTPEKTLVWSFKDFQIFEAAADQSCRTAAENMPSHRCRRIPRR